MPQAPYRPTRFWAYELPSSLHNYQTCPLIFLKYICFCVILCPLWILRFFFFNQRGMTVNYHWRNINLLRSRHITSKCSLEQVSAEDTYECLKQGFLDYFEALMSLASYIFYRDFANCSESLCFNISRGCCL